MTPGQFLRTVWPTEGFYCIAHPFKIPNTDRVVHYNKVFASISEAVTHVHETLETKDVFFGVAPLREEKVWDPTKEDWKTGQKGAWATRLQVNSLSLKTLFFDLDVGAGVEKYATQADAVAALHAFLVATGLPQPMLVSSGGGIHVYWLLDAPVPVAAWRDIAFHMKQLAAATGLKVDPTRTVDSSSVLRVAGTFNYKESGRRAVEVKQVGVVTSVADFIQLVSDAMVRNSVVPGTAPIKAATVAPVSELGPQGFNDDFAKPTMAEAAAACGQIRKMLTSQGDKTDPDYGELSNTAWYRGMICTISHVEGGDDICRKITAEHPRTVANIEDKLVQAKGFAPARCDALPGFMPWGDKPCLTCRFYNNPSVPNPMVAARRSAVAAPPVVASVTQQAPGDTSAPPAAPAGTITVPPPIPAMQLMAPVAIPNPPPPFERLKTGGIAINRKDKDGNSTQVVIYSHDLFPVKRLVSADTKTEQQVWRATLPRSGAKDFIVDADALYDQRKFAAVVSSNGIYPNKGDLPALQDYMVAYIAQLQKDLDADTQVSHLGWSDGYRQFTMPDAVFHEDGTMRPTALSDGAKRATQFVGKRGNETSQIALMRFYDFDEYLPNQFAILASLGSIIFHATGNHGIVVNMSGTSGASKSTTLYSALGLWGDPVMMPINGTNSGATPKARSQRVVVNGNLPTGVDEITHLPPKEGIDLVMNITQPGHRLRLGTDGHEKASSSDNYKSAILIATANSSLHNLLSLDNAAGTAGSMRVFEMKMAPQRVHTKEQADAFLRDLKEHFGHIAPRFVAFVVRHRVAVEKRVQQVMREIDAEGGIQSSERFWSAVIAVVLVAAEICTALGLLPYDAAKLRTWALTVQVPFMRGVVREEYSDPLGVLQNYVMEKHGAIMMVDRSTALGTNLGSQAGAQDAFSLNNPSGALLGHFDVKGGVLYLLKQGFKDYCSRIGATSSRILDELNVPTGGAGEVPRKVITNRQVRFTLGKGTTMAKGQAWCFSVDMTHPAMAGHIPTPVSGVGTPTSPPAGNLRVVS